MTPRLPLLTVVLALALPAGAEAATFCVGPVSCPPGGIPKAGNAAGLRSALDDAEVNNQPDQALIAPGTYVAPTAQGFSYLDPEELDITGSGRDSTIVQGSAANSSVALNLSASGPASVLRNLTVRMAAGSGIGRGLSLQNAGASDVSVDATPDAASPGTGVGMGGSAAFESSTVAPMPAFFRGLDAIGADNTVRDCSVSAPVAVQAALAGAEIAVLRSRITTTLQGVGVGGNGANGQVSNSLIRVSDSGTQEDGLRAYSGGAIVASNVTLIGSGGPTAGGAAEQGGAGSASLEINSSVVRGFANSFRAVQGPGTAAVTVNSSSWDSPYVEAGGANVNEGAGNLAAGTMPGFVDAGGGGLPPALRLSPGGRRSARARTRTRSRRRAALRRWGGAVHRPAPGHRRLRVPARGSHCRRFRTGGGRRGAAARVHSPGLERPRSRRGADLPLELRRRYDGHGPQCHARLERPRGAHRHGNRDRSDRAVGFGRGGGADRHYDDGRWRRRGGHRRAPARGRPHAAQALPRRREADRPERRPRVRIRIERAAAGRRRAGRCVKPRRRLAQAKRCRRHVLAGTLIRRGLPAGQQRVAFSGRLGKRSLAAGRYRALLTATDAAGNRDQPARLAFRIVRR